MRSIKYIHTCLNPPSILIAVACTWMNLVCYEWAQIQRLGPLQSFTWTMEVDYIEHVKKCHQWQIHSNLNHLPVKELYNMTSPWPFSVWGINIIEKITPKASNGHEFILVAIDYFTKWVEATSFSILKAKHVAKFTERNINAITKSLMRSSQTTLCTFKTKFREFCRSMVSNFTSHLRIDHKPMEL